jgi:hypothetical protein
MKSSPIPSRGSGVFDSAPLVSRGGGDGWAAAGMGMQTFGGACPVSRTESPGSGPGQGRQVLIRGPEAGRTGCNGAAGNLAERGDCTGHLEGRSARTPGGIKAVRGIRLSNRADSDGRSCRKKGNLAT